MQTYWFLRTMEHWKSSRYRVAIVFQVIASYIDKANTQIWFLIKVMSMILRMRFMRLIRPKLLHIVANLSESALNKA